MHPFPEALPGEANPNAVLDALDPLLFGQLLQQFGGLASEPVGQLLLRGGAPQHRQGAEQVAMVLGEAFETCRPGSFH